MHLMRYTSGPTWWAPTRCVRVGDKFTRTREPKSISEKTLNSSNCSQNLNSHRSSRWLQGFNIKKICLHSILLHQRLFCEGNLAKSVKFHTKLLKDSLGKTLGIHVNFSKKSTCRYLRVAKELDAHILRFWSTHEYYKCAWYELQTPPYVWLRLTFRFWRIVHLTKATTGFRCWAYFCSPQRLFSLLFRAMGGKDEVSDGYNDYNPKSHPT